MAIYATMGSTRGLRVPYEGKPEFAPAQDGALTRPMGGQTYKIGGRKAPRQIRFNEAALVEVLRSDPAERCEVCHSPHPIYRDKHGAVICETRETPWDSLNIFDADGHTVRNGHAVKGANVLRTTLMGDSPLPRTMVPVKAPRPVKVRSESSVKREENAAITAVLRANGVAGNGTGAQREAVREYLETRRQLAEYTSR